MDTAAVDAFTVDCGSLTNGFFHPPVGQITRVLKQAQSIMVKVVLIIHVWESADFWPVIFHLVGTDQLIKLTRFRPNLVAARWVE